MAAKQKGNCMNRSRSQLANSYAPGTFFTFEGGLGTCVAVPVPSSRANISNTTTEQIITRLNEIVRSWFDQAMRARTGMPEKPAVLPRLCVDDALLNGDMTNVVPIDEGRFVYLVADEMGYVPAPLTFVCQTCKLVRTYEHLGKLQKDLPVLENPEQCPHPGRKKACDWQQLDVMFVHWSGNWERAMPHQYQWDAEKQEAVLREAQCGCGSFDFELESRSPAIGDWFFRCAKCKAPLSTKWLQNDRDTMRIIGSPMADPARYTEARMEAISYRASAVHYTQTEQFIDFKEGQYERLSLLHPHNAHKLEEFIAQQYGFGAVLPDENELERMVRAAPNGDQEWSKYQSFAEAIQAVETAIKANPTLKTTLEATIAPSRAAQKMLRDDWIRRNIVTLKTMLPAALSAQIGSRTTIFNSRFDPFRLAVEHAALDQTKLQPNNMAGGRRAFVKFDQLDTDLAPKNAEDKSRQEQETRLLLNQLGIDTMGLVREFDLCRFSFGYSRVSSSPVLKGKRGMNMPVRLRLFPQVRYDGAMKHPIYVVTQANEAIYIRLNEDMVYEWLSRLGCEDFFDRHGRAVGAGLLEHAHAFDRYLENIPRSPMVYVYTYTLLHTYAHVLMRTISEYSGLDLGSLGEYIFPADLAFVVYRSGATMDLGNLSALWRNYNVAFLREFLRPKTLECGSGSLCVHRGGACPDCIMIPETSCIATNKLLSRSVLCGGGRPPFEARENFLTLGYLDVVNEVLHKKSV